MNTSVFCKGDGVSLVKSDEERALGCKKCIVSDSERVWFIESRDCKHNARKFVVMAGPGADPVLPISEWRGDVNGDRTAVVRARSSSYFLLELLVGAQHIGDLIETADAEQFDRQRLALQFGVGGEMRNGHHRS